MRRLFYYFCIPSLLISWAHLLPRSSLPLDLTATHLSFWYSYTEASSVYFWVGVVWEIHLVSLWRVSSTVSRFRAFQGEIVMRARERVCCIVAGDPRWVQLLSGHVRFQTVVSYAARRLFHPPLFRIVLLPPNQETLKNVRSPYARSNCHPFPMSVVPLHPSCPSFFFPPFPPPPPPPYLGCRS